MQDQSEGWIREAPPAIDNQTVLQQLDRMVKSRHFRNSRRYPAFLAHVVRRTLAGDLDSLKERILGIEVFKRAHDYDTGADPVVRITAGEVRKRIALYYHDDGTIRELRIELPAGSYVPTFSPPANFSLAGPSAGLEPADEPLRLPSPALAEPDPASRRRFTQLWIGGAVLLVVLALAVAGFLYWNWTSSPLESLWRPFFGSPDPVLIVVGSPLGRLAGAPESNPVNHNQMDSHSHVHLSLNDALTLTDTTGLLELHRQAYRIQTAAATSLDDLRKRPVILITAFSNPWSGRILSPLRFSLVRQQIAPDGSTALGSIVDHRNPGSQWNFDFSKPLAVNTKDYAVVARLESDLTEGPVLVIAGLGASATESAGEFVSSPQYLKQINAVAPPDWRNKNLELVLEVPMIDGNAGHARIIAGEFW